MRASLLLICFLVLAAVARGESTVREMRYLCGEAPNTSERAACWNYMAGYYGAIFRVSQLALPLENQICLKPTTRVDDILRIFIEFADDIERRHWGTKTWPNGLDAPVSLAMYTALFYAFPCKEPAGPQVK